jgi:hypothetical protein
MPDKSFGKNLIDQESLNSSQNTFQAKWVSQNVSLLSLYTLRIIPWIKAFEL